MKLFAHPQLQPLPSRQGHLLRMAVSWLMLATVHAVAQQASPVLLSQPADLEVLERDSAIFQVAAEGAAPLAYQWRRNGYDIPDQTFHRLILDRTRMSDNAARFDVVVSNPAGVVTSQVAVLTVRRDSARQVVIYYDDVAGPYNYGRLYVNQFRNLLGHFHVDIEARNVADYQLGDMDAFDAAFYIGSAFDAPLPASFLADAAIPGRTLAWINYNIWQLLWSGNDVAHLGFSYEGIVNGYNRVSYKGENLYKGTYDFEAVHVATTAVSQVYAELYSAADPAKPRHPYALRSGSFWYFADNCFTDDVDLSRSLVLSDLLHDILDTGIVTPQHRALVRIEDINAYYNTPEEVLAIADMLQGRGIRASFGVIPRYISAADCVDSGDCVDIAMSDDPGFQAMLAGIVERGHFLLVHGYTHNNIEEGEASGPGYEFWNHAENRPLASDSWDFAADRVLAGRAEFLAAGLPARIWETPHYEASLVANHAIAAIYSEWYERLRPYNIFSDGLSREDLDAIAAAPPSPEFQTQYLPYTSYQSAYGTKVVPENLNFFSDEWYDSYGNQMNISNKLMYARHLKVVRDGVASFYFHPYLDIGILESFLDQMITNGYVFTDAETQLDAMPAGWSPTPAPPVIVASPEDLAVAENAAAVFTAAVSGSDPLVYQWRRDGLPIDGANGTRLILDPVLGADSGVIDLVLQNAIGSVTSAPALLTVTYPVTYDANGATGGTVPAAQVKTYGVALTLATNSGNLLRTGYTFDGWNTATNGSGTAYAAGASYTANASVTLHARWIQLALAPTSRNHTHEVAAGQTIGVTGNVAWTATNSAAWITITGGAVGSGNGTVTYGIASNAVRTARSGTITVAGAGLTRTFTVNQSASPIPFDEALDTAALTWTTGGSAPWFGQAETSYDGVDAAQSGDITHGQQSWLETTVTGPGVISFRWKVSSETGSDFLRISANGSDLGGAISGDTGWVRRQVTIPAGTWALRWFYTKDGAGDGGDDRGWVDDIRWLPSVVENDFDGDRRSDLSVFHPAAGNWYLLQSTLDVRQQAWGWNETVTVPADYDGDGKTDVAVYYPAGGMWYIIESSSGSVRQQAWGWNEAVPVPADYDGDGKTDVAVYYPAGGMWYIIQSSNGAVLQQAWGWSETVPVAGDFDGDGRADVAVYHPAGGMWYIIESSSGSVRQQAWGWDEAVPVPADYDGDGKTDVAVYHPAGGMWYIIQSSNGAVRQQAWGWSETVPVAGDYDGDGRADMAVYHQAGGMWYIIESSSGAVRQQAWGWNQAEPASRQYQTNQWMGF